MAEAERSVSVVLRADIQDYVSKMGAASKATKDFAAQTGKVSGSASTSTKNLGTAARSASADLDKAAKSAKGFGDAAGKAAVDADKAAKSTKSVGDSAGTIGIGLAAAGAAIAVGVGAAVKAFADFDKEMSNVRAVSGATAGDMAKLKDAALEAGAATVFSASQAATAEAELVKAGISVKDVLGGALKGSLDLASAGSLDLATAATISANAMNIFSLKGSDVGNIANVLAAGANKSAADVDQLGQALEQSGLVASQMGLSLEETVGILSAFADNGLKGSDAGTSFKTMLQRLVPQSAQAAQAMKDIGFSAYDAQGNLKDIDVVAGDLRKGLSTLTQKQKDQTLATIFGSDAVRGANVMFKLGTEGVDDYTAAVTGTAAATDVAKEKLNNLSGDLENLRGSFETALIKGGSGANDALRGLTQTLTGVVNAFGDLPDEVQSNVVKIAALTAGALLLGGGLITVIPKIVATKEALDALSAASPRAAGALGALGKAGLIVGIAAAGEEIKNMAAAAQVAQPPVDDLARGLADVAKGAEEAKDFGAIFTRGMGPFERTFDNANDALADFGANAKFALDHNLLEQVFGQADQAGAVFNTRIKQIDSALVKMVSEGHADDAAAAVARLEKAAQDAGLAAGEVTRQLPGYSSAVDTAAVANGKYADSTGKVGTAAGDAIGPTRLLGGELKDQKQAAEDAQKAYDDLTASVKNYGDQVAGALSASAGYEASIDSAAEVAKKRNDLQGQINELTAAGSAKGSINKKFDAADAKTIKEFDQRIKDAKGATEKQKLRADKAETLASSQESRKSALDDNAKQVARLKDEQQQYAKSLDITTDAGRRNQQLLLDIAKNAKGAAVENFKNGDSVESVQKKMDGARGAFIKQAEDFGASKAEAEKLADQLGLTSTNLDALRNAPPANVTVNAITDAANRAINDTGALLDATDGKTATATVGVDNSQANAAIADTGALLDATDARTVSATITVDFTPGDTGALMDATAGIRQFANSINPYGQQPIKKADGGLLRGPGTGTSDSILMRGSNGEFMQPKRAVDFYGPSFMEDIRRLRLPKYATGGLVGSRFADRSLMSSAISTSNSYGGNVTNDRRINIETVNAADFQSFEREADRRSRLHALGRRGAR